MSSVGLVLSGGGARAAYQVGALRALADISGPGPGPFRVVAGLSAGAINGTAVAIGVDDFRRATDRLSSVWMSLTPDTVFRTDFPKLATLGLRWIRDIGSGASLGKKRANHLLDTTPLRELLTREFDIGRLPDHFRSGLLRGVAVSATNYQTGTTITFFDGVPAIKPWVRPGRIAVRERLRIDHIMASSAIPIFFPPILVGGRFFGDGGIRMTTPTSPAIHIGAEKILAIGVRYGRSFDETVGLNVTGDAESVPVSEIAGVLLNAVFLDALDNDLDLLERINKTLSVIPEGERQRHPDLLRRIPCLALRPTEDLGQLASDQYEKFPAMLRHLLRGIGAKGESGWDLLSYLAFQPGYVGKLIELGYEDTIARRDEIQAFFETPFEDHAPPSMVPPPVSARKA
jgi:NTE family protein